MIWDFIAYTQFLQQLYSSSIGNKKAMSRPYCIDERHEKTDLKVFVVVIPKDGLAGWGPANPSLGMTPTTEYNL